MTERAIQQLRESETETERDHFAVGGFELILSLIQQKVSSGMGEGQEERERASRQAEG